MATLQPHSAWVAEGILLLLLLATGVIWARSRGREAEGEQVELKKRVRTFWVIAAAVLGSLALGRGTSVVFFSLVSFLALREFLTIVPLGNRRILFVAYAVLAVQYALVYEEMTIASLLFVPLAGLVLIPSGLVLAGETTGFVRTSSALVFGLLVTVYGPGFLPLLLSLPRGVNPAAGPAGIVLLVVLLVQLNDVAQYLWGRSLGRRRIAPRVSPNKTVAGFVGGAFTTAALSLAMAPLLTSLDRAPAAVFGLLLAVSGFFGDLLMSAVKRDIGLKDTAQTLPGHGGVLDRIDSLIYAAPAAFLGLRFLTS